MGRKPLLTVAAVWAALFWCSAGWGDEQPKIKLPAPPADATTAAPVSNPLQNKEPPVDATPPDPTKTPAAEREWKQYKNTQIGIELRVKSDWTLIEYKDASGAATAGFSIAKYPKVSFNVQRQPLTTSFEDWISTTSLASLYTSMRGEAKPSSFAGKKGVIVKGTLRNGRFDESYFCPAGKFVYQISFTAPEDAWKDYQKTFDGIKESFHWLR